MLQQYLAWSAMTYLGPVMKDVSFLWNKCQFSVSTDVMVQNPTDGIDIAGKIS